MSLGYGQNRTVGLIQYDEDVTDEYLLLSPYNDTSNYVINKCGEVINSWRRPSAEGGTMSSYLLSNGNLLQSKIINDDTFKRPGKSGAIQIISWENEKLWEVFFTGGKYGAHHDVDPLENGNLLVTLWERFDSAAAVQLGRHPDLISGDLWTEAILEIEPVYPDTFNVVWEWHVSDHLVQDLDSTLNNFGSVSDSPNKIDVNYLTTYEDDWLHINSVTYDEGRDEIVLSNWGFNEIWVIDRSVTTAEASGPAGDLLYRFGNPQVYGRDGNQILDSQHDAKIIYSDESEVRISCFNNKSRWPEENSNVIILSAPIDVDGRYVLPDSASYDSVAEMILDFDDGGTFDSRFMSSFDLTDEGHFFVSASETGLILEYDEDMELLWEYVNPVNIFGIAMQGDSVNGNQFKTQRIDELTIESIVNGEKAIERSSVEIGNTSFLCDELSTSVTELATVGIHVFPNPVSSYLTIENSELEVLIRSATIADLTGKVHQEVTLSTDQNTLDVSSLHSGMYYLVLRDTENQSYIQKLIKI